MKISRAPAILVGAAALFSLPLRATTCVAGKSFKVSQVCGAVTDKDGAVIPDAKIQITPKNHLEGEKDARSDKNGDFVIPNVTDGEYELRVKYSGFWDAWQPFRVSGSGAKRRCTKPIHVVMVPAGGCSYVENAWRKSELKK